jgi:hypothetical protein
MGNTYIDSKGYPRFKDSGIAVHTAVAQNKIGRELRPHEVVHHKNGDKTNFRSGNLRVTSRSHHAKMHSNFSY